MRPFGIMLAAFFVISLGAPAAAQFTVYKCTATSQGAGGWVGEVLFLALDVEEQEAAVLDWAVNEVHGEFIGADATQRSNGAWKVSWLVEDLETPGYGKTNMRYSMTFNSRTGAYSLRGFLPGYDNNISGRGTCELAE